jgi:hypothetical protein
MRTLSNHRAVALGVAFALFSSPLAASAAVGDNAADRVLGQPNASSSAPNSPTLNASSLYYPFGAAFDAAGNLFVVDYANNRVLGYRAPMTTDLVADLVLGQPDFNSNAENNSGISASTLRSPIGVAVSPAGDVYVADSFNHRVLGYERPFATDAVADRIFGQPDFMSRVDNNGGVNAGSLSYPVGVAVDAAGNLWVADYGNNRVLMYTNPAATSDRLADLVLGQVSFTANTPNNGGVSARSLSAPTSVAVDAQRNVWVVDSANNRVLEFDDLLNTDVVPDRVLGQPDFGSREYNYTGQVSAAGLRAPNAVSVDPNGNVYVADTFNNRILFYTAPIATQDRIADRVFGQADLNSAAPNIDDVSAKTLAKPSGVAIDRYGNVAICDTNDNRVVLLQTPTPIVTSIAVKVTPATGKAKLLVDGYGMVSGSAVVEVDGTPLATTKYKSVMLDGTARRLVGLDPNFDTVVPSGLPVKVTVFNPLTGGRSAPIPFTR